MAARDTTCSVRGTHHPRQVVVHFTHPTILSQPQSGNRRESHRRVAEPWTTSDWLATEKLRSMNPESVDWRPRNARRDRGGVCRRSAGGSSLARAKELRGVRAMLRKGCPADRSRLIPRVETRTAGAGPYHGHFTTTKREPSWLRTRSNNPSLDSAFFTAAVNSSSDFTACRLTCVMTIPLANPARSAGLPD